MIVSKTQFELIALFLTVCQCQSQLFSDFGSTFAKKRVQETVSDPSATSVSHPRRTTIIDVLKELRATTFLQLIQQTQLGSALQGSGPYTVFAPTDDAIDRLPKWAQRKLLADSETLAQMLVYHITVDKITSKDMKNELRIPTLLHGKPVTIRLYADRKPTVNHVTITVPDAIASNGVVHVIGDTLFPVPVGNVFDVLENCTSFSKFRDYILKAGLDTELKNPSNPITLFAPTNDAFELMASRVKNLLENTNNSNTTEYKNAQAMLLQHVVLGTYFSPSLKDGQELTTASERELLIGVRNDRLREVGLGRVLRSDIPATNGVVHGIDRFLAYDDVC
ncbi:Periostin [Orchesella cincta]|uniref:Periostin n=1 Tax=Orchesella cincta TaxID=48709 RepID=A0A1D2N4D2_ORCCI|nr:Periostin [Orchesella cincta]